MYVSFIIIIIYFFQLNVQIFFNTGGVDSTNYGLFITHLLFRINREIFFYVYRELPTTQIFQNLYHKRCVSYYT